VIELIAHARANLKQLPTLFFHWGLRKLKALKGSLLAYDYKSKCREIYDSALSHYKAKSPEKIGQAKLIFMTPVFLLTEWLKGLTAAQTLVLITFSGASFLATMSMIYSGHRIAKHQSSEGRAPASAEEEIVYERPEYYKKELRHFQISNFRLPVYIADVNEVGSVDIDFTATVSNRNARMELEKLEFQLRDFLIHHLEPSVATFPLQEEGKEIIRKKLWEEVDNFLRERNIQGHVVEIKITYVLAN
jgi:flagellar basal body-associated protein FliL